MEYLPWMGAILGRAWGITEGRALLDAEPARTARVIEEAREEVVAGVVVGDG